MINANLILPYLFGKIQPVTFVTAGSEHVFNIIRLNNGFSVINSLDFYIITLLTFISPVLCFIIALANKPVKLFRFLSHSTALYAALSPPHPLARTGISLPVKLPSWLLAKKTFGNGTAYREANLVFGIF